MKIHTFFLYSILIFFLSINACTASVNQPIERPFIWASESERSEILEKINKQPWRSSFLQQFSERLISDFSVYQKDKIAYLSDIPFDKEKGKQGKIPPLLKIDYPINGRKAELINYYLQVGVDCSIMYYLTRNEEYAQCALDILYTFVKAEQQMPLSGKGGNIGRVYTDHLREAREIGTQMPIMYDFLATYIRAGAKAFDFAQKKEVSFPVNELQQLFRERAEMVINLGSTGSNWSVLEAPSMVTNLLAIDDVAIRNELLDVFLEKGSKWQDPLSVIADEYDHEGAVYPETSQYSNGVSVFSIYVMAMINRYDPSLNLVDKYKNIPLSLTVWEGLVYPNGQIVRFGDGKRKLGANFNGLEMSLLLAEKTNNAELKDKLSMAFSNLLQKHNYQRGYLGRRSYEASVYNDPIPLFLYPDSIKKHESNYQLPRTFNMKHAGVYLQRNLSTTNNPDDGLMCFVGGAPMVHGHATGMDMELYGEGHVLGVDHGRGKYRTEMHENYSRLYAAHNSVIVNGSSCSEGGWVNMGINSVALKSMEPMPKAVAVSPNHSFTSTTYVDDKGELAEALQERTLSIIRTSDSTGYYVDVFRSKSKLPDEYHDYLYHNIGDDINFFNDDLQLTDTPNRYMATANDKWIGNRNYRHPGWHYFEQVKTSVVYSNDVKLQFTAEKFLKKPVFMNLYIPGADSREYTKVKAPKTYEAPYEYEGMKTPTLLIRKKGEAWDTPFVVVYEPFGFHSKNNSILSVEQIVQNNIFKALKIKSKPHNQIIIQYIILPGDKGIFNDKPSGISFNGDYAVITLNKAGKLLDMYMGEGEMLAYGKTKISSRNGQKTSAFVDFTTQSPTVKSNDPVDVK